MAGQIDRKRLHPYLRRLTPLDVEGDMAAESPPKCMCG